jgi:hypothetical protein
MTHILYLVIESMYKTNYIVYNFIPFIVLSLKVIAR